MDLDFLNVPAVRKTAPPRRRANHQALAWTIGSALVALGIVLVVAALVLNPASPFYGMLCSDNGFSQLPESDAIYRWLDGHMSGRYRIVRWRTSIQPGSRYRQGGVTLEVVDRTGYARTYAVACCDGKVLWGFRDDWPED